MTTIYIKPKCPYCIRLLKLLKRTDISYEVVDVMGSENNKKMQHLSGEGGVPQVHIGEVIMPDYDTEEILISDMKWLLENSNTSQDQIRENTTSKLVFLGE